MSSVAQRKNAISPLVAGLIGAVNILGDLIRTLSIPVAQLSEDRLMRSAERKVGLTDFWNDSFRIPFQVLLRSFREECSLTFVGSLATERRLRRSLENRLLIADALKRNPDVLDVPIRKPLFIVSLPRTGTTFLHKLLANDPNARYLTAWEGIWPVRRRADVDKFSDSRLTRARRVSKLFDILFPRLKSIHKFDPDGPEECIGLMKNTFVMPQIMWQRSYRSWLLEQPSEVWTSAYLEYRQQLQLIQYARPLPGYWLLKSPVHIYGIDALLKLFPDSVIVLIHRDPVESIPSMCSLLHYGVAMLTNGQQHLKEIPEVVLDWVVEGLMRAEVARGKAGDNRVYDIRYEDLVLNPLATVEGLYAFAGHTYTRDFQARASQWLKNHPKNKYGNHIYSLDEFGLTRGSIRDSLSWYYKRYLE